MMNAAESRGRNSREWISRDLSVIASHIVIITRIPKNKLTKKAEEEIASQYNYDNMLMHKISSQKEFAYVKFRFFF